jgi:hypothetical protein
VIPLLIPSYLRPIQFNIFEPVAKVYFIIMSIPIRHEYTGPMLFCCSTKENDARNKNILTVKLSGYVMHNCQMSLKFVDSIILHGDH